MITSRANRSIVDTAHIYKIEIDLNIQTSVFQPFSSRGTFQKFLMIWRNLNASNSTIQSVFREPSKEFAEPNTDLDNEGKNGICFVFYLFSCLLVYLANLLHTQSRFFCRKKQLSGNLSSTKQLTFNAFQISILLLQSIELSQNSLYLCIARWLEFSDSNETDK